ncbi:MAG: hypothetical protein J6S29_06835 [Methanosphaera sp.]|nr:hypothetical protein [Methanosphaera sp.]
MVTLDDFDENMYHAEEFKNAYLDNDMSKLTLILLHWLMNGKRNGFFKVAHVIVDAKIRTESFFEVLELYKSSFEDDFDDPELYKWYNDTAVKLLEDWAKDVIMNNPELKKKFEEFESE